MRAVPALAQVSPDIVSLGDHEKHARQHLDDNAWAYFSGGAGDEITLRSNQRAWEKILLSPRVLQAVAGGHTRLQLLGRTLAHPILLAPVAFQRMAHPDAELATAHAAAALGAGLVLSTQSSVPLESVAQAILGEATRGPLWFQLYLQPDRGFTRALVQRAEQAGFEALVLTVDAPVQGVRDRERRAGFKLPQGVSAANLRDMAQLPHKPLPPGGSRLFDDLLTTAPVWADVAWLLEQTSLPVVLKGVSHVDDARQARALAVAGLIVSNHGGRTLDTVAPTASALPRLVDVIAGSMPVLVDGGLRRGTDVLKAIALGATAVLVGRPYVYGLANAGAIGVAHVVRLLRDELEVAMALCGCRTLDQVSPALLLDGRVGAAR